MPKQINSFILPDDIIKEMKDKIKETKKLKIEVGFALCSAVHNTATDKEDSRIISKGTECTGTKCSVKAGRCREDQINIGNYHTHPKSHPTMSITDMVTGCSEEIECIGSALFNNISCFVRKTEESQCLNDTSPFEEEEHKILEKGEEIRTILRNPRSIIRTGIPKILREISQYDTHIAKYHKNRFKLLDNNFNRINIT